MRQPRLSSAALALFVAASPLAGMAQTLTPDPLPLAEEGPGLIEQGLKRLFEGLITEMEPALRDLGGTLQAYEPLMRQLAELVGDLENYQSPERLPNGDILLRRKPGAPPPPALPDTSRPAPERSDPPGLRAPPSPPGKAPRPGEPVPDAEGAIEL